MNDTDHNDFAWRIWIAQYRKMTPANVSCENCDNRHVAYSYLGYEHPEPHAYLCLDCGAEWNDTHKGTT